MSKIHLTDNIIFFYRMSSLYNDEILIKSPNYILHTAHYRKMPMNSYQKCFRGRGIYRLYA